jgi:uncharacterized protein (DUF433 family)
MESAVEIIKHIEIRDGQAVIKGRGHLKAKMVARKHLWESYSIAEVMEHYDITASEVYSAIAFYLDNQQELDAEYEEAIRLAEENALTLDKFKQQNIKRKL